MQAARLHDKQAGRLRYDMYIIHPVLDRVQGFRCPGKIFQTGSVGLKDHSGLPAG